MEANSKVGGNRFTLIKPLGRGGMGEVWLAQDERLGEPVALKFLPPEVRADPAALHELRRETAHSHKLTHPNIVRIHDLHEEAGGMAFIAMEYVDGSTLSALRLEQPNYVLAWEYLRPLAQQLCAALDYAHGESVVHRDLKPANIMVDGKGRLKLADFGIAATVSDSVSHISLRHATSGTLLYMSPQQLAGKRPQAADDIYALGATLYELLTSQPPFFTGDITHQVLHEAPKPLEARLTALGIQNEVPPDVAAIVMACLAKDPAQRPQSARAVAEWVGLEVVSKPSLESLAGAVFAQSEASQAEAERGQPPLLETAAPAVLEKKLALAATRVVAALLLVGAGLWYVRRQRAAAAQESAKHTEVINAFAPPAAEPDSSALRATQMSSAPATVLAWLPLFDGKSLNGWHSFRSSSFPPYGWVVENGWLRCLGKNIGTQGDLISDAEFYDFELEWEWKQARGGNSGVKYFVNENRSAPIGYEYQMADDALNPEASQAAGKHMTAALYDILPPSLPTEVKPPGEINYSRVLVNGNHVEHWLNGHKVLEYSCGSDGLKAAVAASKFKDTPGFADKIRGHILLQDHQSEVWFRNVKLRELPGK